ncbi:MAG TPA: E3 binding domain-containing protein, partial [Bacteroidia bacterium]|nr:E3 binding domain-containing protein [Bacteroidia bacterium]
MAEIVRMPKMSDTMTEGVVAKWHKKVGDVIKSGDLVAEIETDKATMEFESYQTGVLLYRGVEEGKAASVNGILAILGNAGESFDELLAAEKTNAISETQIITKEPEPAKAPPTSEAAPIAPKPIATPAIKTTINLTGSSDDGRIKASPLAKKLAADKGLDVRLLKGSGDNGRVIKRDIEWYKPGNMVETNYYTQAVTSESAEDVPVSQMRKTIAKRLSESKFTAPHFYLTMEINMDNAMAAR